MSGLPFSEEKGEVDGGRGLGKGLGREERGGEPVIRLGKINLL